MTTPTAVLEKYSFLEPRWREGRIWELGRGPRRDWARFGDHPSSTDVGEVLGALVVAPDGMCADAEGAVWAADAPRVPAP